MIKQKMSSFIATGFPARKLRSDHQLASLMTIKIPDDDHHWFPPWWLDIFVQNHPMPSAALPELARGKPFLKSKTFPAVTITLPFEPKMMSDSELVTAFLRLKSELQVELLKNWDNDALEAIVPQLEAIIARLDYYTHKKSVAIHLSPFSQKVMYLDIPLQTKIYIERPFSVFDIVESKKPAQKFLLVSLGESGYNIYLGNPGELVKLVSALATSSARSDQDSTDRENQVQDFIYKLDSTLAIIHQAYPHPVFIKGSPENIAAYMKLTRHEHKITKLITSPEEDTTIEQLRALVQPLLRNWTSLHEEYLIGRLKEAAAVNKLVTGFAEVIREANRQKKSLLVAERPLTIQQDTGFPGGSTFNKAVEKTLENGGDAEWVSPGMLEPYQHIALIKQ